MAGKLDTNNIQDWGLEEYAQYFDGNKKLFGEHSEEFKSIQNIVKKMSELHSELQNQNITMDNYIKLDDVNTELKGVCSNYEATHTGFKLFNGRERLNVVNGLKNYWSNNNLDQLREKSVLDRYEKDKSITWGNLKVDPAASIKIDGFDEKNKVGENASERFKVEYKGKKGFFTAEQVVETCQQSFLKQMENETNPCILDNQDFIFNSSGLVSSAASGLPFTVAMNTHFWKKITELDSSEKGNIELKDNLSFLLKNGEGILYPFSKYHKEFTEANLQNEDEKKHFFTDYVNKNIPEKELQDSFIKCQELLRPYVEGEHEKVVGKEAQERYFEFLVRNKEISSKKELGENSSSLTHFLENEELKQRALSIMNKTNGAEQGIGANLDFGDELTKRNIASSRIADLLGVGQLIARSEKMTVQIGDKKLEGCFMENADGVDVRNGNDKAMEQISQVSFENGSPFAPGFTKDACNLEILDYICAQVDRHGGNIFLKLSEPDEMGYRQVVGLQGIDNDLALSTETERLSLQQGDLKDLCFISENLADTISNLTKDQVKYAVKDLLNEGETSALWTRIQTVQKHIAENMIKIDDKDWDLDKTYSAYSDKESAEAKRFKNGLDSLTDSYNKKEIVRGLTAHKNGAMRTEIENAQEQYKKEKAKQAETAKEQPEKQVEKEAKPEKEKPEKQVEKQAEPAKDSHSKRAQLKQTLGSLKRGPKIIKSKFKENATYLKQKLEHSSRNMKRRVEALKRMKESFKEVRDFVKRGGNYIPNDPKLKSMNELKSSFGIMKEAAKQNMRQQRKMDANFAAEKEERTRQHLEHRKSIRNEKGEPVEDLQTAPKEKISHDKLEKAEKEAAKANTTKKEATEKTSSAPTNNKAVVAANRQKVDFNGLQAGFSPHKAGIAGAKNYQHAVNNMSEQQKKSILDHHDKLRTIVKSSNGPAKK